MKNSRKWSTHIIMKIQSSHLLNLLNFSRHLPTGNPSSRSVGIGDRDTTTTTTINTNNNTTANTANNRIQPPSPPQPIRKLRTAAGYICAFCLTFRTQALGGVMALILVNPISQAQSPSFLIERGVLEPLVSGRCEGSTRAKLKNVIVIQVINLGESDTCVAHVKETLFNSHIEPLPSCKMNPEIIATFGVPVICSTKLGQRLSGLAVLLHDELTFTPSATTSHGEARQGQSKSMYISPPILPTEPIPLIGQ